MPPPGGGRPGAVSADPAGKKGGVSGLDKDNKELERLIEDMANEMPTWDRFVRDLVSTATWSEAVNSASEWLSANMDGIKPEVWRTALPYMMAVFSLMDLGMRFADLNRGKKREIIPLKDYKELIIQASEEIDVIWGAIKHFYPDIQDGADGTPNPEGLAIARDMLERLAAAIVEHASLPKPSPKIKTKRATSAILGLSKVEGNLFNVKHYEELFGQDGGEIRLKTGTIGKKKEAVVTLLSVDWDEKELRERGISIPSWNRLTAFDRAVYTAVASLHFAGNQYITSRMVFQVLCGNKAKANPTQEILNQIAKSIERMSRIRVTIDAREEVQARHNVRAEFSGNLLSTQTARVFINGVMRDCIEINTEPILHRYARAKKQIAQMDVRMLDAPVSNTLENIELKDYLMRRVAGAKSEKGKMTNVILYSTLYEYLGLDEAEYSEQALRNKKKDVRDATKRIFEVWTALGEISGFHEVSKGRVKEKIVFELASYKKGDKKGGE